MGRFGRDELSTSDHYHRYNPSQRLARRYYPRPAYDHSEPAMVITTYALALAALTITGGRLGDLFGRKKMFITGAAIFAIGSYLASISHSVPVLLLGESIIEGIGAA